MWFLLYTSFLVKWEDSLILKFTLRKNIKVDADKNLSHEDFIKLKSMSNIVFVETLFVQNWFRWQGPTDKSTLFMLHTATCPVDAALHKNGIKQEKVKGGN